MTERSQGAPDPDEPVEPPAIPTRGAALPQTGAPPHGGPQGRAAVTPAADLSAVRRTDAIFDALGARRAAASAERADPSTRAEPGFPGLAAGITAPFTALPAASAASAAWAQGDPDDPAVRLLSALISDVDEQAPAACRAAVRAAREPSADVKGVRGGEPAGSAVEDDRPHPHPPSGPRRRGPRAIVALGVAGAVLASTGVAAAGGGLTEHTTLGQGAAEAAGEAGKAGAERAEAGKTAAPRAPAPVRPLPVAITGPAERGPARAAGPAPDRPRRITIVRAKDRTKGLQDGPAPRPRTRMDGTDDGWSWPGVPSLETQVEAGERTRPRLEEIRKRWRQRADLQRERYDRD
ncbi:hypothetical protein [Actinomadura rugatobispora]|uniref:Uncharacterized protein n=1 Tax=Actinomadura rugatobispora TaxID=1994 RepID=A0ABW1A3L7_9ACTN|nr:hypothetical protein GCM10010200_055610 [Actinomadura rugatobispora]